MRIAMLCNAFPHDLSSDPVMPAHSNLARALKALGHEVMVCAFVDPFSEGALDGVFDVDGIAVHQISYKEQERYTWSQGLNLPTYTIIANQAHLFHSRYARLIDDFKPDVIDCQDYNALAFFFAAEHKYPLVIHSYGPLGYLMRTNQIPGATLLDTQLVESLEYSTIASADAVIACSKELAQRTSTISGVALADIDIIRVPLTLPGEVPRRSENRTAQYPELLYFGRVETQKGIDILVESLPSVREVYPDVQLSLGGRENPADIVGIRQRINELNLDKNINFLGYLSRQQIKQRVVDADLCVFPSRYETAGYACLESVSYGGAAVATAVGGLPEYHEHGKSVWLVQPNSPSELAAGICRVISDEQLRKKLKAEGREHVLAVCKPDEIAKQTIAVYQKAAEKFASGGSRNPAFQMLTKTVLSLIDTRQPLISRQSSAPTVQTIDMISNSVSSNLSRVWKEGYDAGMEEGLRRGRGSLRQLLVSVGRKFFN